MRTCPHCNELNGESRSNCWKCGTALGPVDCYNQPNTVYSYHKICRNCGAVYPASEETCQECGTQLSVYSEHQSMPQYSQNSNTVLYVISALIPLIGIILGCIYIAKNEDEFGKSLILTGIIAQVIIVVFAFFFMTVL